MYLLVIFRSEDVGVYFFSKSASTPVDQKKPVVQILSQHLIGVCVFNIESGVGSRGEVPYIFSFPPLL